LATPETNFERIDEPFLREKERRVKQRNGTLRDRREHLGHHREPSMWQKELRERQRGHLRVALSEHSAHGAQMVRLNAFQCLRDGFETGVESPRIGKELELGPFGGVGLSIGSPPHTPKDERAMREWVVQQELKDEDMAILNSAHDTVVKDPNKMSSDELLDWLRHESPRTSFEPIMDILQEYGVLEEFVEAPSSVVEVLPNLPPAGEGEAYVARAKGHEIQPRPPVSSRVAGKPLAPRRNRSKEKLGGRGADGPALSASKLTARFGA